MDYTYDQNGLRVSKTVDGIKHTYLYASGKLLRESYGNVVLDFFYDQSGYPYAMTYKNGTAAAVTYYYITNLQGDVLTMITSTGTSVASYTYDPYGKPLTATGTMATINPLRYRGYYYDTETGFYYLQSRYYDPGICRFINADSLISNGRGIIEHNMFAYCNNNSINALDPLGDDAIWLQDPNNAISGPLGHTGLLIENEEGHWYYFNWYDGGCTYTLFSTDKDISIEELLETVEPRYTKHIYFKGDFSVGAEFASRLQINAPYYGDAYTLHSMNCMQVVVDVLMRGKFEQDDEFYKFVLRRARRAIIPNNAYSEIYNAIKLKKAVDAISEWICRAE